MTGKTHLVWLLRIKKGLDPRFKMKYLEKESKKISDVPPSKIISDSIIIDKEYHICPNCGDYLKFDIYGDYNLLIYPKICGAPRYKYRCIGCGYTEYFNF